MKKVYVYKNLHKGCWSVRDKKSRRVIDHADVIVLDNAEFKVSELGRQRVLREKKKNVHAGVEGYISSQEITHSLIEGMVEVTYNPYKHSSFVVKSTQEPIKNSELVVMTQGKVYAL